MSDPIKRDPILVQFSMITRLYPELTVHFFGKNPNPDSESRNGFFFFWQVPIRDYESSESVRDEDSMD